MKIRSSWLAGSLLIGLLMDMPGASMPGWSMAGQTMAGEPEHFPTQIPSYAQPRALRQDATLRSVAFNSDGGGIACGDRGAILRTADGGERWEGVESGLDCTLQQVQWVASNRAVIVGGAFDRITGISRGVVLISDDAGASWRRAADDELPQLRSLQWEDDVLVASGDWSDSLLTNRFESRDRGRSWHAGNAETSPGPRSPSLTELIRWAAATQMPMAIRHACRVNENAICAVGDHGVILISRDRGESWSAARGEGRRTAVLIVASDARSVPWALLGSEALESRSRVALLLQDPTSGQGNADAETNDRESSGAATSLRKACQAAVALGASGADLIAAIESDPTVVARQWIGIHRPAVLVVDPGLSSEVSDAFFQAATAAGVGRVLRYSFAGYGDTALHQEALLAKSGILASDLQADAMHWIDPFHIDAKSIQLKSLYDAVADRHRGESLLSGMNLPDGYRLAAPGPIASRHKLQIAQARMNQANRIAAMIDQSRSVGQFSDSLSRALDLTGKEDQFRLAWSMLLATAEPNASLRVVAFHDAALEQVATRFQSTSAGRWAALRRNVIANSVEWGRLRSLLSESLAAVERVPMAEAVAVSPFQVASNGVRQVSGVSPVVVPKPESIELNQRKRADEAKVDIYWEFHPLVLFAREAAKQRNDEGLLQVSGEESANLKRLVDSGHPWSRLVSNHGAQTIVARQAVVPPRLDGVMEDECWRASAEPLDSSPAVRLAYDEDYVYIAVQCPSEQIGPDTHADQATAGSRDQDLSEVDRMTFWIDIDRDLMSTMQLQISASGRVHDAIDGHPAWQPTWYPAVRRNSDSLIIEMAILRRDLVHLPITPGESWFVLAKPIRGGQSPPSLIDPNPDDWYRVVFQP